MATSLVKRAATEAELRILRYRKRAVQSLLAGLRPRMPRPVLLVGGVQRSGTNMLMSVLDRSFETEVFHESDPRAFEDYAMRPVAVIRGLVEQSRARCVVLKALCELQEFAQLLDDFSPAKALWIVRDYNDMVNSHLRTWSGCPVTIGRLVRDRNSAQWRGRGMSDATHDLLTRLYHPDINDASAVAIFWYFRNVLFFEQGLDRDSRVLPLQYESLARSPHEELKCIFRFLGLDCSRRIAACVHAASVRRHHPPSIDQAVRLACDELATRFDAVIRRHKEREQEVG